MKKNNEPKKIVIMRTDRIGEVLLSTVAIDAIKKSFPDSSVSFVTSEYSKPIVESRTDIDEVMTTDTMGKEGWFLKSVRLASLLRKKRFDMAIMLNPHKSLHLAAFLAGISQRVGYGRKWGFLLNRKITDERDKGRKHEVEYTMDLLRSLDVTLDDPKPLLPVDKEAEKEVRNLLVGKGIQSDRPVISVHPGSSNPAKIWPRERYSELIRRLKTELDCYVCILGSDEERIFAREIIVDSGVEVLNLTGALSLKELTALLKKSSLFVGNDTGPMHMAAALDVPVIAIFGRNTPGVSPTRWRPWGDKHVVFHEDPGCAPCYDKSCSYDHRCLRAVNVDVVFEAAKKIVKS